VVLDLFDRTRERELAMVTRTIVALCCGKPVVHPPFTEVSPLIEEFSAGWLVDPADEQAVARTLAEIIGDPELVTERARGARRLWAARLDPSEVVQGLERVIEQIHSVPEYVP
jgi:glycosyltransferase involved in cell wall biosynthesis